MGCRFSRLQPKTTARPTMSKPFSWRWLTKSETTKRFLNLVNFCLIDFLLANRIKLWKRVNNLEIFTFFVMKNLQTRRIKQKACLEYSIVFQPVCHSDTIINKNKNPIQKLTKHNFFSDQPSSGEVSGDGKNVVRVIHRNGSLNEPEPSYCCF